jgi:hypothetical protein
MATAGRKLVFKLDNSAGALTDITSKLNDFSFPQTVGTEESTTFGDESQEFIATLKGATIDISGDWDSEIDSHLFGIQGLDATQTFEYYPTGESSGNVKYSGECRITSYEISSPVGGKISFSASLQITGDLTREIVP